MKGRAPLPDWRPTGWRGRICIEITLELPGGARAKCLRNKDLTWDWWTGYKMEYPDTPAHIKTLKRAQLCAEAQLRRYTRSNLRKLEKR